MSRRQVGGSQAIEGPQALLRSVPTDVVAGLVLVLFSGFCIVATQNLDFGSSAHMGPGYFPRVVSGLIGAFGIVITMMGLLTRRTAEPAETMSGVPWRAMIMIILAILFFAVSVEHLGLLLSSLGMIVLTSLAAPQVRPLEIVVFPLLLAVMVTAIFSWGLGLGLPALPNFG